MSGPALAAPASAACAFWGTWSCTVGREAGCGEGLLGTAEGVLAASLAPRSHPGFPTGPVVAG